MQRFDRTELVSGFIVILIGVCFSYGAFEYRMGTVSRMGPGFVPYSIGLIMIAIGVLIMVSAFGRGGELPKMDVRSMALIGASVASFAILLPRVGLVPSAIITVVIGTFAVSELRPMTVAVLACVVAAGAWVVFVLLLGISIPVLRNPF